MIGTLAPSGRQWCFHCSVGVDCRSVEPRCIWLASLGVVSPPASPQQTPVTSPPTHIVQRVRQHPGEGGCQQNLFKERGVDLQCKNQVATRGRLELFEN